MTAGNPPKYHRARQIAETLGLTERTIRRWISDETLPSSKIGGARLVADADLERLLSPRGSVLGKDHDADQEM